MLVIRAAQMQAFEASVQRSFDEEMLAHSRDFEPRLSEALGDRQLRAAVRSAIERARGYGLTCRGPIRLFIEMCFLCGSAFDTDPQYPAFGDALRLSEGEMARAEKLYQAYLDYLERVSGPDEINARKAHTGLLALARNPAEAGTDLFSWRLQLAWIFPEKAAYVGEAGLQALIQEATDEAGRYGFVAPRQKGLIGLLMFALGHGITNDPLHPWVARTLRDKEIVDPAIRAERLEKRTIDWLERQL